MIYRCRCPRGDELYDTLIEELFRRYHPFADQLNMDAVAAGRKGVVYKKDRPLIANGQGATE